MCLMSATAARRAALTTSSPSSTAYSVIRIVSTQKRARNLPQNPSSPPPPPGDRVSSPNDALKGRRLIKGPGDILLTFVKFLPNKISTSRAHKTAAAAQELKRCVFPSSPSPHTSPFCCFADGTFKDQLCHLSGLNRERREGSAAAAGKSQTLTKRRKTCDTKCGEA